MSQVLTTTVHESSSISLRELPRAQHHSQRVSFDIAHSITNILPASPPDSESEVTPLRLTRLVIVIAALAGVNLLSSLTTGFLTVGLPRIGSDLGLDQDLLSWPLSVYALTSGSCLLLAGSVADVVGNRIVNLAGCFGVACFIIACGVSRTGTELIIFRALQGVAVSMCMPTSVAIIASVAPSGRKRNIGFSILGFVQSVGFSMGLVLEGVLLDTVGWRLGYYLSGALTLILFAMSIWALPPDKVFEGRILPRLRSEIDWIGAAVAMTGLSLFSYVLFTLTNVLSNIRHPAIIAMLSMSLALGPAFVLWERRQEKLNRPALIPNSLWKNTVFTSVCLMVMFSYAIANFMELFCSLFFQEVQNLSALQASIRILPSLCVGAMLNLATGFLIHRAPAFYLVLTALILSAGGPLLMAVIDAKWPYWYDAFFAQLLAPISADIMFTVGLLVVSDGFPATTQAVAGAVFNTVAQFGISIGFTVMTVISASVTKHKKGNLMEGYRASFWAAFGVMVIASVIAGLGLRRMGKVGLKRD